MTEPAPQQSPHRGCENDLDHVAWEQIGPCSRDVGELEKLLTYLVAHPVGFLQPRPPLIVQFDGHGAAARCVLAGPPEELLELPPQGGVLLAGLQVTWASLQLTWRRKRGRKSRWGEERADSNSVTEVCLVSSADELSCFISRSDSVSTTFDAFGLMSRPVQTSFMLSDVSLKNGVMIFWLLQTDSYTGKSRVCVCDLFLSNNRSHHLVLLVPNLLLLKLFMHMSASADGWWR